VAVGVAERLLSERQHNAKGTEEASVVLKDEAFVRAVWHSRFRVYGRMMNQEEYTHSFFPSNPFTHKTVLYLRETRD
jgi:lysophospholipid acyltransferase (LPLAT)-like uncharacterized protein